MKTKGFTLIELLVVVVIIGILVAIALPNFIKIKDKAREAEVKQNLHAIQLAIERYATDYDGIYPYYLYGGESLFNIGTINGVNGSHTWRAYTTGQIVQPFDMFWLNTDTWDYNDTAWGNLTQQTDIDSGFGDTLEYEGYMPKFPRNPFQVGSSSKVFGIDALSTNYQDHACFGGYDGDLMWNIAWFSEGPQYMFFSAPDYEPVRTEYQGNFAYHARWSDETTNHGHFLYQVPYHSDATSMPPEMTPPLGNADVQNVASLDVAGYDLTALGSERTKGQDLDDSMEDSVGAQYWRTGYLTLGQERNPWTTSGMWGNTTQVDDYDERPFSDGIPDFLIIHLGSGMDKKVGSDNSLAG
ncbi:MAG: type II secretion system protein [Planctomycetales bacterium]|nr:type II secretion system protein [bacterium]UNM08121.1 MAG: type II secretion system protein [Planctomycetales bacterium]